MATKSKRAAKSHRREPQAISMLVEDHRKVQKLFKQFENADETRQQQIVEEACNDLTVHAQLEEQVFYPAVRDAIDETDLVDEATVEHDVAKDLIEKLKDLGPGDPQYAATFCVLGEYINHHIEEEQNELFPKVRKASLDFESLAGEMWEKKQELREELGLEPERERPAGADGRRGHAARSAGR
jgi:hemerythrin-like domain-containing protein